MPAKTAESAFEALRTDDADGTHVAGMTSFAGVSDWSRRSLFERAAEGDGKESIQKHSKLRQGDKVETEILHLKGPMEDGASPRKTFAGLVDRLPLWSSGSPDCPKRLSYKTTRLSTKTSPVAEDNQEACFRSHRNESQKRGWERIHHYPTYGRGEDFL
ncbi:unnamed protein product [Protopolystoma xenopodis]|uniref:Uncharacterized protein n=1 Tax=Protopolystoma xenopodis TaxID=117903 RepID=A0A448X563_9PLAT|nr:unnamed protein product [Protopolystoma xenopodis]